MTDESGRPDGSTTERPDGSTTRLPAVGGDPSTTQVGIPSSEDRPAPTIDRGALASLRPGTALLLVEHGPNAGARFLLDHDLTTVGRHSSSDIFLDDVTVSRKHAEFVRSGTSFTVRDVGSLNGTYVNRERIDDSPLRTGDEVQVGKFRLVVMLGDAG